jgi:oligopeptidase B
VYRHGFRTRRKSGRFKSYEGVALEYAFLIGLAQETLPGRAER